jgi:hypothetical protein
MPPLHRTSILLGSCAAFMLGWPQAAAQMTFFGALPSDADEGYDGDEAASAEGLGIFARKPFKMTLAVREGSTATSFRQRRILKAAFTQTGPPD